MPDPSALNDAFEYKYLPDSSPYVAYPNYILFGHLYIGTKASDVFDRDPYFGIKELKSAMKNSQKLERHFASEEGISPMKVTQPKMPFPTAVVQAYELKRKVPDTLDSRNDSTEQLKNIDGENIYDSDSNSEDINSRALAHIELMGEKYPLKLFNVVIYSFAICGVKIQEWIRILADNLQAELKYGKYGNYCLLQFPIVNITNQHIYRTAIFNLTKNQYKNTSTTNK